MAKINEQVLVIKVSQLLKDSDTTNILLDGNMVEQIEAVVQQLAEEGAVGKVLVEIMQPE